MFIFLGIILEADSHLAIPLLVEMLQTPDENLTLTVTDSLRTMGKTASELNLSQEVITRLQSLAEKSPVAQTVMNEFLKQVPFSVFQ